MANRILYSIVAILVSCSFLFAAGGKIGGTVNDATTGEPLIGANIVLQGTTMGAATNELGVYSITNIPEGEYVLVVSFIGYLAYNESVTVTDGAELTINVELVYTEILGEKVIISASRRPEKITDAPATIGLITSRDMEEYAGNPGELFGRLKGVDYIRTG
ncbi:MAG: carboxypeptidase-like regulatory domain-containing protein, partial [Ignavibacteria bacterium]